MLAVVALVIAAWTGEAYQRRSAAYVRYEGVDPGMDSTRVVAGGWPLPWLFDNPSISVVGRVSLTGALVREDTLRPWRLLTDAFLFWIGLLAIWTAGRVRRNPEARRPVQ